MEKELKKVVKKYVVEVAILSDLKQSYKDFDDYMELDADCQTEAIEIFNNLDLRTLDSNYGYNVYWLLEKRYELDIQDNSLEFIDDNILGEIIFDNRNKEYL